MSRNNECKLYLIQSSENKKDELLTYPANELYDSELFSACVNYLEAAKTPWLIMSVLHGLLWPTTVIAPYDLSKISDTERESRIRQQLDKVSSSNTILSVLNLQHLFNGDKPPAKMKILEQVTIVVLGNSSCLNLAVSELESLGCTIESPLAGKNENQQIKWLNDMTKRITVPGGLTSSPY